MSGRSERKGELDELAGSLLEVVPLVMRSIRAEMRANHHAGLTVPQFRVLNFVHVRGRTSLSDIAEHVGLSLASMSKMVEGMVVRGLMDREIDSSNRRRVAITITERGREAWNAARTTTRESIVRRLRGVEAVSRGELLRGLGALRPFFSEGSDPSARVGGRNADS